MKWKNERINRHWMSGLFIGTLLILGMPLDGSIPMPAGLIRESNPIASATEIIGTRAVTSIVWGGIYVVALLAIAISPYHLIKEIKNHLVFLLLFMGVFISALWSPYPERNLFDGFQLLGVLAVCLVASQRYKSNIPLLFKHTTFALGLNLLINLLAIIALPRMTMHPDGRWAGVTGSANYLGDISLCCIWACFAWLAQAELKGKWFPIIVLMVAAISLIGSNSITSLFSSLIVLALFIYMYWLSPSKWRLAKTIAFYLIVISGVLTVAFTGVDYWLSLLGRDSSVTGRNIIWLGAIHLIQAKPLLGYGFSSNTETLGVLHWATTFHNGFLEVGVKLGLIGLFLFVYTIFQFFRTLSVGQHSHSAERAMGIFVVTYLFYNLSETAILMAKNPAWIIFSTIIFTIGIQKTRQLSNNALISK